VTSPGTAAVRRPLAEVLKHRVSLHQMVTAPTAAAAAGAAGSTEPAAAAPAAAAE